LVEEQHAVMASETSPGRRPGRGEYRDVLSGPQCRFEQVVAARYQLHHAGGALLALDLGRSGGSRLTGSSTPRATATAMLLHAPPRCGVLLKPVTSI
jgi:hypothetical protein